MAVDYLAEQFDKLVDPFEICIVTYALHVANHKMKTNAFLKMRSIKRESMNTSNVPCRPTYISIIIMSLRVNPFCIVAIQTLMW